MCASGLISRGFVTSALLLVARKTSLQSLVSMTVVKEAPKKKMKQEARRLKSCIKSALSLTLCFNVLTIKSLTTTTRATATTISELAADRVRYELVSPWVEYGKLKVELKPSVDLGQGFADYDAAPRYLLDALVEATLNTSNSSTGYLNHQYTRSYGHPRLVKALLNFYRRQESFAASAEVRADFRDEFAQVLVTVGAYEALLATILAFVNPGDEVILIEPTFDAYAPMVAFAGGKSVYVPLRFDEGAARKQNNASMLTSESYKLDMNEFEACISNKTKLIVLNTPNNPLGKMYSRGELEAVAMLAVRHNLVVLADEVYDQIYYDAAKHISIASLPGMWRRTVTVGSAGKTFSVTGWKIGWAVGARELIGALQRVHQSTVFVAPTLLQEALAQAFERSANDGGAYWRELRFQLSARRSQLAQLLANAGLRFVLPQGGYFLLADFGSLFRRPHGKPTSGDWCRLKAEAEEDETVALVSKDVSLRAESGRNASSEPKDSKTQYSATAFADLGAARALLKHLSLLAIPSATFEAPERHIKTSCLSSSSSLASAFARDSCSFRLCFIKSLATLSRFGELLQSARLGNHQLAPK